MATPCRYSYSFVIDGSDKPRIGTIVFDSEKASEESEVDKYDDCREKIQAWLDKHFPGEVLATTGDDIERDFGWPSNDDEIDMTTTAFNSKKRPAEEAKHEDASAEKKAKASETNMYRVKTQTLMDLVDGSNIILAPLTAHLFRVKDPDVMWPDEFRVAVRTKDEGIRPDDDTDGLQYYEGDSTKPFLKMGWSDDGFYLIAALMRSVGTRIVQ